MKIDVKGTGFEDINCNKLPPDMVHWREFMNAIMNLLIP
jgi:hypothetical protein